MKVKGKSNWFERRTAELVEDLNAVRAAVLEKEKLSPAEYASFEPRLFESWVIEKLAHIEGLVMSVRGELDEQQEELEELRDELRALRKDLSRSGKKKD